MNSHRRGNSRQRLFMNTDTIGNRAFIHRHRGVLLLLLLALLLLCVCPAWASGDGKTVRVAMEDSEMFITLDADGIPVGGYGYEYIQTIAAYSGWTVEYTSCTGFPDCLQAVSDGRADIFYDVNKTEERRKLYLFPNSPMGTESLYLFTLAGNTEIHPDDNTSFNGKTLGTIVNSVQTERARQWAEKNGIDLEIIEFASITEKAAAFEAGKIDLICEIDQVANSEYTALKKISSDPYYLVVNRDRADLVSDINSACERIEEIDPFFVEGLEKKYFSRLAVNKALLTDEQEWLNTHKTLKLGYMDNYLPFSGTDENGEPDGIVTDIVPDLLATLGINGDAVVEYIAYKDTHEMAAALRNGEIDAAFPLYNSQKFAVDNGVVVSSEVISISADLVYKGKYTDESVASFAVNGNNILQEYYTRTNFPKAEIVYYKSIEDGLRAVDKGEVGATIMNGLRTTQVIREGKYKNLSEARLSNPISFSFAVASGNTALLSLLNRAIAGIDDAQALNYALTYIGSEQNTDSFANFIAEHRDVLTMWGVLILMLIAGIALFAFVRANKARHALEEANASKTSFLSNMSHDIRTPLNAIIGFTDIAVENVNDTDKVSDCLSKIQNSGNLLLSLINSVLDMSRLESGKVTLDEKPTDVMLAFTQIADTTRELAEEKNINLSFSFGSITDRYVYCDIGRCERVFLNIISNAVKYSLENGTVKVHCEQIHRDDDTGLYQFTISDNGIGMSPEFQKHVFEPFARENSSTASGVTGTGLGLSVCKEFVEAMGGTITFKSQKGKGTTFIIRLPLRLQKGTCCTDSTAGETVSADPSEKVEDDVKTAADEMADVVDFTGRRVLLVEDNELNVEIAKYILEEAGLTVETAENGAEAVLRLEEKGAEYYDYILMDIQMPVMDGYEAAREIRKLYPKANLPIIALSANAFAEDKKASLDAGMNDHVAKPIDIHELKTVLAKYTK